MKKIKLLCSEIESLPQLHSILREILDLPNYYGENFDALFDCLTDIIEPTYLEVRDLRKSGLGAAARVFRQVLLDADQSNPNFHVKFTKSIS